MSGNKRDINKNIKITLLSSKDLFKKENNLIISNNLTNIFKNIGIRSAASDLALINGSFAIDEEYVDCNQRLNNRSVSYYLKNNYGSYNLLITLEGTISWVDNNIYNVGIRPVLEFEDFPIEIFERLFNFNGSSYVYFGEYPQVVASNQQLLKYLVDNEGIALSRDKILNNVWNYDYYGDSRTIDSHIKKIRHKLGKKGKYIETIRGIGYKFEVK